VVESQDELFLNLCVGHGPLSTDFREVRIAFSPVIADAATISWLHKISKLPSYSYCQKVCEKI
jgi:hypothetical protein